MLHKNEKEVWEGVGLGTAGNGSPAALNSARSSLWAVV